MSRATRKPKTIEQLDSMSLQEINAELTYLKFRVKIAGNSPVGKAFRKEIDRVERVQQARFQVARRKR